MKCLRVKPNPSSLLWMIICLGDLVLKTEAAEAACTMTDPEVGSSELSRLELEPGAGEIVAGVHVSSRCSLAAS